MPFISLSNQSISIYGQSNIFLSAIDKNDLLCQSFSEWPGSRNGFFALTNVLHKIQMLAEGEHIYIYIFILCLVCYSAWLLQYYLDD